MRMIAVKDIQYDMVLGKSIYTANNQLLLGAGFRLNPDIQRKLTEKGYTYIYILEEGTEEVIPADIISDEIKLQAQSALIENADKIQDFFQFKNLSTSKVYDLLHKGYLRDVNITYDMKQVVDEILKEVSAAGKKFINTMMLKSKDTYLLDHATNTTVLAILIGQSYRFSRDELLDLALGTFLHDFGKIVIEKFRESVTPQCAEELMNEHPTFGYLIVSQSRNSSPIISQIINQHHEHQDGSGYPIGLRGENLPPLKTVKRGITGIIFRLAEICAAANAYDNLSVNPFEETPLPPSEAVKRIVIDAGTKYNKNIITSLVKIIAHYPVGAYVKITYVSDPTLVGYTGVVARVNERDIHNPVIILLRDKSHRKVQPRMIDTSKFRTIELQLVL